MNVFPQCIPVVFVTRWWSFPSHNVFYSVLCDIFSGSESLLEVSKTIHTFLKFVFLSFHKRKLHWIMSSETYIFLSNSYRPDARFFILYRLCNNTYSYFNMLTRLQEQQKKDSFWFQRYLSNYISSPSFTSESQNNAVFSIIISVQ